MDPVVKEKIMSSATQIADVLSRGTYFTANLARPLFNKGPSRLINPFHITDESDKLLWSDMIQDLPYFQRHPVQGFATGLAADIAFDPLTYVSGIGALTKAGKAAKYAKSIGRAGVEVLDAAKAARAAAPWYKRLQAGARVRNVNKWLAKGGQEFGENWAQQAARRQRSLFTVAGRALPGTQKLSEKVFAKGGALASKVQKSLYPKEIGVHVGNKVVDAALDDLHVALQAGGANVDEALAPLAARVKGLDEAGIHALDRALVGEKALSPEIQSIADALHGLSRGAAAKDVAAGRLAGGQVKKFDDIYEASQLTPEGRKVMDAVYGGRGGGIGKATYGETVGKHAMSRMREPGESVVDANFRWQKWLAENPDFSAHVGMSLKPKKLAATKLFEENPIPRFQSRLLKTERAEAHTKFIDRMLLETPTVPLKDISDTTTMRNFMLQNPGSGVIIRAKDWQKAMHGVHDIPLKWAGQKLAGAKKGGEIADLLAGAGLLDNSGNLVIRGADQFKALEDILPKFNLFRKGRVPGHFVSSDVKMVMDRLGQIKQNPQGFLGQVDEALTSFLRYWKPATLANLGTWTRNAFSNVIKSAVADAAHPAGYVKAYRALRGKAVKIHSPAAGAIDDIVRIARQNNVLGSGQTAQLLRGGLTAKNAPTRILRGVAGVNRTIEEQMRLAHFINRIEAGDTIKDAALSVNKYLFDYGRSGPLAEKAYAHLMPFGRWYANNIPNELENIVRFPAKYITGAKGLHNIGKSLVGTPPNEEFMADYMSDELAIPARDNGDGTYSYFVARRWLPVGDIISLIPWGREGGTLRGAVKNALEEVGQQLGGPYKTIIESMANFSTYTGEPISKYPGQMGKIGGVLPVGRQTQYLVEGLVPTLRVPRKFVTARERGAGLLGAGLEAGFGAKLYRNDPKRSRQTAISKLKRQRSQIAHDIDDAERTATIGKNYIISSLQNRLSEVDAELQRITQ